MCLTVAPGVATDGRCGQNQDADNFYQFFSSFLQGAGPVLDAVSWHYYPMYANSVNASAADLITPDYLNRIRL